MQTADKQLSEAMISDDTNPDSKVQGVNMGPTWAQMGPMLAPWTFLSGNAYMCHSVSKS